jgi:Recombinase
MPRKERVRETLTALPTLEHLVSRVEQGWKLIAIEWERDAVSSPQPVAEQIVEEIPFGLRVADDCSGLVESPSERQIVITALDMIVDDRPLSQVADELNRRGYKTRDGGPWTPTVLFVLLPRMIEIGPRLFTSTDWSTRKQRLQRVI